MKKYLFLVSVILFLSNQNANAWGRHGHAIVNSTAAYLIANKIMPEIKPYAFDLAYYSNIPDIAWRVPATGKIEAPQHYMDMEIFNAQLEHSKVQNPYELSRAEFAEKFPHIKEQAGRAWWRIREMQTLLQELQAHLSKDKLTIEERHKHQARWLVIAGTMGHYVGDLSQPLHTTENYDGQKSNQKGVHAFFEDQMVDELQPLLATEVWSSAQSKWADFHTAHKDKSVVQLLQEETAHSHAQIEVLLKIDKDNGRGNPARLALLYKPLLLERLSEGSLYLAEFWNRDLGWKMDTHQFFSFISAPEYVYPSGSHP
jgi:hypothetical protein